MHVWHVWFVLWRFMIHEYEGNRAEQGRSRAEQGRSRAEQSRAEKMVHHLKLVPWESWQLWSRVCDGLFSSSPEAALNKASLLTLNYMLPNISACVSVRIQFMHTFSDFLVHCLSPQNQVAAWRSRSSLPISVEITAELINIQRKDPHFSWVPFFTCHLVF